MTDEEAKAEEFRRQQNEERKRRPLHPEMLRRAIREHVDGPKQIDADEPTIANAARLLQQLEKEKDSSEQ